MNLFAFGQDPAVTKRCPHCDTALEFISCGQRIVFTAHDDEFCNGATRHRVKLLEHVLLSQREAYERLVSKLERRVDVVLAEHGLPSLREQAKEHEVEAKIAALANEGWVSALDRPVST